MKRSKLQLLGNKHKLFQGIIQPGPKLFAPVHQHNGFKMKESRYYGSVEDSA